MTRCEYNAMIQDMQSFCLAAGLSHRVDWPWVQSVTQRDPVRGRATFDVFFDGRWIPIGEEMKPFSPENEYRYDDERDAAIRYHVAGSLNK